MSTFLSIMLVWTIAGCLYVLYVEIDKRHKLCKASRFSTEFDMLAGGPVIWFILLLILTLEMARNLTSRW